MGYHYHIEILHMGYHCNFSKFLEGIMVKAIPSKEFGNPNSHKKREFGQLNMHLAS